MKILFKKLLRIFLTGSAIIGVLAILAAIAFGIMNGGIYLLMILPQWLDWSMFVFALIMFIGWINVSDDGYL